MRELEVALIAGRRAARLLVERNGGRPAIPATAVAISAEERETDLDGRSEHEICAAIRDSFPDDRVVSETGIAVEGVSGFDWYIDPIDGTDNLIAARSEIAVSIARYSRDVPRVGVILLPCRGIEVYSTIDDPMVYLNGEPVDANVATEALSDVLVGLPGSVSRSSEHGSIGSLYDRVSPKVRGIRVIGAIAYELAQISLGELDARFSWAARATDVAAGVMIVRKVGGVVTDACGDQWTPKSKGLLAARDAAVHRRLLSVIQQIATPTGD